MRISDWSSDVCSSDLSAALKGEESRQVLYLLGPVGAGKSSLIEKLRRGLEEADPIYAIEGCPMQEEPLHLIPRPLRREFEKMLDVPVEGELCPICRFRVEEEHGGRYENVPVTTVAFSRSEERRGGKEWVSRCRSRGWPYT